MTPTQRETIREVIGHLWTLDGPGEDVATVSGSYAQDLINLLACDKSEEENPPRMPVPMALLKVAEYISQSGANLTASYKGIGRLECVLYPEEATGGDKE